MTSNRKTSRCSHRHLRDLIHTLAGLVVIGIETWRSGEPRWQLLIVAAYLLGLPVAEFVDRLLRPGEPTLPSSDGGRLSPQRSSSSDGE